MDSSMLKTMKQEVRSSLSKNLKTLRKSMGYSQSQLGDLIGMSSNTIHNIEKGEETVKWPVIMAILFIFVSSEKTRRMLYELGILNKSKMVLFGFDSLYIDYDLLMGKNNNV